MVKLLSFLAVSLIMASCASPERDGIRIAKEENRCAEECIQSAQKLESTFVSGFNPNDYTLRAQALEAYRNQQEAIAADYHKNLEKAAIHKSKVKGKYSGKYANMEKFEKAYNATKDDELSSEAISLLMSDEIPPAVIASVNQIKPLKPSEESIINDLEGHTLSEGFGEYDRFFSETWNRTIGQDVSIKEFHMEGVESDYENEYSIIASMVLQEKHLSYDARVQIYYVLPSGEDWKIDFVKSLGVTIVQTHKYDDCIDCSIDVDDGWGGFNVLYIKNKSEVELVVLGNVLLVGRDGRVWRHFNQVIPPGEKKKVGGLFSGGSIADYEIIAVERV